MSRHDFFRAVGYDPNMLPPIATLINPKALARERAKAERRAAAKNRPDASVHAARHFMDAIDVLPGAQISLYDPIDHELDIAPLAGTLLERGANLALPVVIRKKAPLIFRRYEAGDDLVDGVYGARIPTDSAEEMTPEVIVAPLLAFTRRGDRLGYGGGFYDRTLSKLRKQGAVLAVGYAFGAQEVDALPVSPLDQPLDWIVTEREAIKC